MICNYITSPLLFIYHDDLLFIYHDDRTIPLCLVSTSIEDLKEHFFIATCKIKYITHTQLENTLKTMYN